MRECMPARCAGVVVGAYRDGGRKQTLHGVADGEPRGGAATAAQCSAAAAENIEEGGVCDGGSPGRLLLEPRDAWRPRAAATRSPSESGSAGPALRVVPTVPARAGRCAARVAPNGRVAEGGSRGNGGRESVGRLGSEERSRGGDFEITRLQSIASRACRHARQVACGELRVLARRGRQTNSFIENSIEAGILLGGNGILHAMLVARSYFFAAYRH
jgi:hypothetical protein